MGEISSRRFFLSLTLAVSSGVFGSVAWADLPVGRGKAAVVAFGGPSITPPKVNPNVKADLSPDAERFFVRVPQNYDGVQPFGLLVYISPADQVDALPVAAWAPVLASHKLLFIAPQAAGNTQAVDRRFGLAVMAALEMKQHYQIDPARIYAAGFSGGARMAGDLGFYESSIFRGTIQASGTDFPAAVPKVTPRGPQDRDDADYGQIDATAEEIGDGRANVRFTLITGSKDFRHAAIVDMFHGGFEKEGFSAKLFDLPGAEHQDCGASTLDSAIRFIEGKSIASATQSVVTAEGVASSGAGAASETIPPAAWSAKDPAAWPQMLLYNRADLRGNRGIGGSGFLMRLPNGAVVATTVKHVMPDDVQLESLDKELLSWVMWANTTPPREVTLEKLAMKLDPGKPTDCVLMTVRPRYPWTVEVLSPRPKPVEVGEKIYVLGVPNGQRGAQMVFSGKVLAPPDDHSSFWYGLDTPVDTMGFSGAPVVDGQGHVVGIHTGHGTYNGSAAWAALDINAALNLADAPAPPASRVMQTRPIATTVADPTEAAARSALEMAHNYIAINMYPKAREKLQSILDNYPKSHAAIEAKQMLMDLPDQ